MPKYTNFYSEGDRKQITFYTSKEVYQRFQTRYPNMATIFFNKAYRLALKDKEFFDNVVFSEIEGD